jgi:pyruvate/2-oxoglutarate dehydrogenase complex dihydrolipoamide dehydrogenase (E3) component
MILRAAEVLAEAGRVDQLAGHASVTPDYTPVADRIRDEATDGWDDTVAVERLEGHGATFVRGAGALAGRDAEGRLRVRFGHDGGDHEHTADRVVVATGTAPAVPPIPGLRELRSRGAGAHRIVWTNRDAVQAHAAPASLIVLGGGAIGCELGQGFARFGTQVTIVEAAPRILMPEEPEASRVIAEVFEREGIDVRQGVGVASVGAGTGSDRVAVTLADGSVLGAETLLVAAGRVPNLHDIGLETIGLDPDARTLPVDEHQQAQGPDGAVPGLFAIGDITGRGAFTHVSMWQARVLVADLLDRESLNGGYEGLAGVDGVLDPGLDPWPRQRRVREGGCGRRSGRARRGDRGRAPCRRGHGPAGVGRARGGAGADVADDALRVPDVAPGHRGRRPRARLTCERDLDIRTRS